MLILVDFSYFESLLLEAKTAESIALILIFCVIASRNFRRCDRFGQSIQHNSINPSIEFANVSTLIGLLIRTQPLIQTETCT